MTPAVYILCGIPFSGKSTLARTLAMQRGWTHVDVDGIVKSLIDSEDSDVTEYVIYFEIPVDEADRRRVANQGHPQRHQVSAADFLEVVRSMEPPTDDEISACL